jgi:hypothetical protein
MTKGERQTDSRPSYEAALAFEMSTDNHMRPPFGTPFFIPAERPARHSLPSAKDCIRFTNLTLPYLNGSHRSQQYKR